MLARKLASTKAAALGFVRRGPRTVIWTPHHVQLGNLLYYWLNAYRHQRRGEQRLALETERSAPWRSSFPDLFDALVIRREDVALSDRRLERHPLQHFDVDFSGEDISAFIQSMLLQPPTELAEKIRVATSPADVVVNVRRGDYYSVPRWRGEYSFDVVEYVRTAIREVRTSGPITSIQIVSDDLDWCRIKLNWLADIAPVQEPRENSSALEQLALLATAPRLVLTNSTFGYWGAYIADALRPQSTEITTGTWAPAFHSRSISGGRAYQLNPKWNVIESIPGGWDG